jgi:cytochrome c556
MRGRSGWLMVSAVAVFSVTVAAGEKPPESYAKNMKDTQAASTDLRKSIDTKDYDAIAKHASTLKTLFENTEAFWTNRKTDDAIGFAKAGSKAAADLAAAAKAKNDEGVTAQSKALLASCKSCHDAHRERLPDGSSEIK